MNIVVESQSGFFTTAILKWNYYTSRFVHGPKPLRWLFMAGLLPCWYLDQKFAPFLDNWTAIGRWKRQDIMWRRKNRES